MLPLFILTIEDDKKRENTAVLYKRFETYLLKIAYVITDNFEDAEDALNNAFVSLIQSGTLLDADDPRVKAQLVSTVRNKAIDIYKSNRKHFSEELNENMAAQTSEYTVDDRMDLEKGLLKIPKEQTELLELYYYKGYSTQEIAELKGMKQDTVRKKIKQGRELLKKLLLDRRGR